MIELTFHEMQTHFLLKTPEMNDISYQKRQDPTTDEGAKHKSATSTKSEILAYV